MRTATLRRGEREMLAQEAAYALVGGNCADERGTWNALEATWAHATTKDVAADAAAPLIAVCQGCPLLTDGRCRAWAEVDRYTGIAAGTAWVNGAEKDPQWTRHHHHRARSWQQRGQHVA